MSDTLSLYVSFEENQLENEEHFDRNARLQLVERGIQELRTRFPLALFGPPNPTACAVSVHGTPDVIQDVVGFLENRRDLASYVIDGPVIRSAHSS